MTANSKYAPKAWKTDRFDIECPSGQLCLARKLQMEDIVQLGIIDDMDMFTGFAATMGADPESISDDVAMEAVLGDKARFAKVVEIVDKVIEHVVLEPKLVRPVKKVKGKEVALAPNELKDGVIYTSYVDFNDRMHIFSSVFTGETIDQFRS